MANKMANFCITINVLLVVVVVVVVLIVTVSFLCISADSPHVPQSDKVHVTKADLIRQVNFNVHTNYIVISWLFIIAEKMWLLCEEHSTVSSLS